MGFLRPNQECSQHRTPVKNLYLGGSSVYPGGCVIWGPDYSCANVVQDYVGVGIAAKPLSGDLLSGQTAADFVSSLKNTDAHAPILDKIQASSNALFPPPTITASNVKSAMTPPCKVLIWDSYFNS
jgi:hypothetical protein